MDGIQLCAIIPAVAHMMADFELLITMPRDDYINDKRGEPDLVSLLFLWGFYDGLPTIPVIT